MTWRCSNVQPKKSATLGDLRLRVVHYEPHTAFPPHTHSHSNFSMILDGEMGEHTDGAYFRAGAGDCVIKPAGTEHANSVGSTGATTLQIELNHAGLRAMSPADASWQYAWLPSPQVSRDLFLLAQEIFARGTQKCDDQLIVAARTVLQSALRHRRPTTIHPSNRPDWLTAVEREISCTLESGPSVAFLAALVDVHPVHLARTFRRVHGCTVVQYIHRVRIQTATKLLRDPTLSLADIAVRVGCCDQAHLCRLFAARIGISPRAFRMLQAN